MNPALALSAALSLVLQAPPIHHAQSCEETRQLAVELVKTAEHYEELYRIEQGRGDALEKKVHELANDPIREEVEVTPVWVPIVIVGAVIAAFGGGLIIGERIGN